MAKTRHMRRVLAGGRRESMAMAHTERRIRVLTLKVRTARDPQDVAVVPDEPNAVAAEAYEQTVDRLSVGLFARKDGQAAFTTPGSTRMPSSRA